MNISRNAEVNKIRKLTMYSGCIHEDSHCVGDPIHAHSIQLNKYLKSISVNGQVICIDFAKMGLTHNLVLREVGKKEASTFTGFCNYHDKEIFLPIEDNNHYTLGNMEQNFLFAYRAFALSFFERYSTYNFIKYDFHHDNREELSEKDLITYKKHLGKIEQLRKSMNTNLDNKHFNKISTRVLVWPKNYKIAVASMFFIYKDREGNIINNGLDIHPFFITVLPDETNTYVLLSYLTKDKVKYDFINRQIVQANINDQKMLISNIIAMNVENFFIAPDKWETLPQETKSLFIKILEFSVINKDKPSIGYFSDLNIFQ